MTVTKLREPRWPAFVAMLADALLYLGLPENLSVGPRWILPAIILILLVPIAFSYRVGRHDIVRILIFMANGALTLSLIGSLGLLLESLPHHEAPPGTLLRSAASLWLANVLVFALWYWKLDGGGPLGREKPGTRSSFLFPQLTHDAPNSGEPWYPIFLDYLYMAFNTSTAFSPTDTPVLARWAKVLMMLQSLMSLSIIALLAAYAVGTL